MPASSEIYEIPGNGALSEADRTRRIAEIYRPFHAAVSAVIAEKLALGIEPVLVTVHSFTRVYYGKRRRVDFGILHDSDERLAQRLLAAAGSLGDCVVGCNEPYGPQDGVTHTLKLHAVPRGLENVMFEIANDLIGDDAGQALWAARIAGLLRKTALDRRPESGTVSRTGVR
jgi:predicted N-formylglutamate amidohydrolase